MDHELKTLTARLLAQRWLPRNDKLVRRALVDETFRFELDRRLADVGLRLLDNPYAAHVGVALEPELAEPVFGAGRDFCTAFINIDLTAVGNWAERNNIAYASYQELAGHPQVYDAIREHVEAVNASVAQDPMLSGCQISRFLVLHKELDPDDGEMTRTRKVRRNIIAEKYADLIAALYDGRDQVSTRTEVTYEDGRKGEIRATLRIEDVRTLPTQVMHKVAAE